MPMKPVVSFEESPEGACGDLLSRRPAEPDRPRVGLLACGYFEYWRMFSPAFKRQVLGDIRRFAASLRREADVVFPGVVDTLEAAERAGRAFARQPLDLLVVLEGTYVPDFMSLQALDQAPGVPVVLVSSQTGEDIGPRDDYERLMRNSALIGTTQLSGSFKKMGRACDIVVGALEDPALYAELGALARTARAVRRLRRMAIGLVGHVFRGMYDLENDKTKIKAALGPSVITVDLSHLVRHWKRVSARDASRAARAFAKRFRTRGIRQRDLEKSVRVGLAMQRLVDAMSLDGLCFLGQHYIEREMDAPARIGACMLMDSGRCLAACEGDLAGLAVMQALQWIGGTVPLQAEWGQYDKFHNALFLVGHGVAAPSLAASAKAITLTPAPEMWGFQGSGVNLEFIVKPGPVTMSHVLDTARGWQMLVAGGESLDYPCLPCREIHALVRVERPVKEFLAEIQRQGVPHHVILAPGDSRRELKRLAAMLGMRAFEV